ncbi:MAG: hypothetical protein V5A50_13975, partial [Thiohalorhabdus sp.]|uniref:hypothetical protein n=1 Tax=Thiohalorhabdus sp. TaxID=3094134 RepID=UPI002FC362DF
LTGRHLTPKERDIEREYQEPIAVVIRGFAELGYSKSDVAGILGYSKQDFLRRVLPRHDEHGEIRWSAKGEGRAQKEQKAAGSG